MMHLFQGDERGDGWVSPQKALALEPLAKPFNPVVACEAQGYHSEAMAALRSGLSPHWRARFRITLKACFPSITPSGACDFICSLSRCCNCWKKSSSRASVCKSRYLSTNASTPRVLSQHATSVPSVSMLRNRKPPPGQTITAVPLATDGSGRYAVKVGCTILRTTLVFLRWSNCGRNVSCSGCDQFCVPRALSGQIGMTSG